MDKTAILNELLEIIAKYLKINIKISNNYTQNRQLFRGLCNQCLSLNGIDNKLYKLQDKLLSMEREEKGIVDVEQLVYKGSVTHFNGDITTLKADAIVNAANGNYLGCFVQVLIKTGFSICRGGLWAFSVLAAMPQ